MKEGNNARTLDEIADAIHKLERSNLFDTGDLLIEAKDTHRGEFIDWVDSEFEWSADTAENYMKAAKLSAKYGI